MFPNAAQMLQSICSESLAGFRKARMRFKASSTMSSSSMDEAVRARN